MTDGDDLPDEPPRHHDPAWLTVRRAEIALALSVAAIAAAYALADSGSAARLVVTFAAGAVALVALRFLIQTWRGRG
jgi:hypothetical protein